MKYFLFIAFTFITATVFGQTKDSVVSTTNDTTNYGPVIVHKDGRLDLLVKKQAQINESTSREAKRTDKGFRLMIISTNSRDEVYAAKTKVYTYFPELKAYVWYQSPYFRLKAGNFKDRKDAEAYQKRLNGYFPKGVFIMKDVIEIKPVKSDDDTIKP